jgi:hypothetical protein
MSDPAKKIDLIRIDDQAVDHINQLSAADISHFRETVDKLQQMEILQDKKTLQVLSGLNNIAWIQSSWKAFLMKCLVSIFFDFIKVGVLVLVFAFTLLQTIPSGHLAKLMPILGYGDSTRVNAGLALLSSELSGADFQKHFVTVEKRINREIALFYDYHSPFPGMFEFNLLEDLYGYDFVIQEKNLMSHTRTELGKKLNFTKEEFLARYGYDSEFWKKEGILEEDLNKLRSFKILATQGRFVESLSVLKEIKDPGKIRSYKFASKWAFHQAYLESKDELHKWIGKQL